MTRVYVAGALVAAAIACGPRGGAAPVVEERAGEAPSRAPTAQERAGRAIYDRENCARCHTLLDTARGSEPGDLPAPPAAASIPSRVGPDLGLEGHRRSDDWQLAHLYAPDVVSPGSPMPAARHLFRVAGGGLPEPEDDARALVAWLQTLGRERRDVWAEFRAREPEIPAPDATPASDRLDLGGRLYGRHCVACHGEAGDGRGPAAPLLDRPPRSFVAASYRFRSNGPWDRPRDADLFRAITLGTGTGAAMPAFYFLPASERWALVARIKAFSPALAGGAGEPERPAPAPPGETASAGGAASGGQATGGADRLEMIAKGRALWSSLGCARCHGEDAAGRSAAGSGVTWIDAEGQPIAGSGDLRHACSRRGGGSDVAFDRAIRFGVGTAMPSFGEALAGQPDAARALRLFVESPGLGETAPGGR
ncbi:MAG TPA: c-type cytochrome [Patescibacteria group bacterium]|nr:c-type cytochrome [Patescibacteria group bacterium]